MNIAFIYEDNSEEKSIKDRIVKLLNKICCKIKVIKTINDRYRNIPINRVIICIPRYKMKKINKRFIKKLIYVLRNNGIKNIVLSEKLKEKIILKNLIYSYNYNIISGKFVIKTSIVDILEYIMKNINSNIQKEEISILANESSKINLDIISNISKIAKRVNIITNNISKFKNLEKKLYEQNGIMISIGNNRKKGLVKSRFIINLDFPEELLNKYKIYRKAIILNVEENCKIDTKLFSGIIIDDINIKYNENIKNKILENNIFSNNDIYDSRIIAIDNLENIRELKNTDNFEVLSLIGKNGIIHEDEYLFTKKLQ